MQGIQSMRAKRARLGLIVVAGLLGAMLVGAGSAAAQTTGQADPVGTVQQYIAAFNAGDTAALRTILDPSYQGTTTNWPADAPPVLRAPTNMDGVLQIAGQRQARLTASNCVASSANSVQCAVTLESANLASLPHPYTQTAVYTVSNGKIVRAEQRLSDTTRDDFSVIFGSQQPGMPATGSAGDNGNGGLFLALVVGATLLVTGLVARRRGRSRRTGRTTS